MKACMQARAECAVDPNPYVSAFPQRHSLLRFNWMLAFDANRPLARHKFRIDASPELSPTKDFPFSQSHNVSIGIVRALGVGAFCV